MQEVSYNRWKAESDYKKSRFSHLLRVYLAKLSQLRILVQAKCWMLEWLPNDELQWNKEAVLL